MMLIIGKPYIKNNKLISKIKYSENEYDMFFEVEDEYIKYLCEENANAFLISLIPFIVKHEYDVKVEGKISSKLYYQLINYLLPLLCKEFKKKLINIDCDLTDEIYNSTAVGASISCGVDSFYTLLKHKNQIISEYNITHLAFFNAGSNGEYGGEKARKLYKERLEHVTKFCKDNNYHLVSVDSNMNELIMMNHEKTHTFRTLGCVFALEKLFGKYYFASGLEFNGSRIDEDDTAYYDILNVHCLSNENISFYCSGLETTRMEKIKFISEYSETYNSLNVCVDDKWENCSKCEKCIRTMTALESIGKLEKYSNVFDLNYYESNKVKIQTKMLKFKHDKIKKDIYKEIIISYKENNKKIATQSKIRQFIPNKTDIKRFVKNVLPSNLINVIRKNRKKIKDGWTD